MFRGMKLRLSSAPHAFGLDVIRVLHFALLPGVFEHQQHVSYFMLFCLNCFLSRAVDMAVP